MVCTESKALLTGYKECKLLFLKLFFHNCVIIIMIFDNWLLVYLV